jgi:hypothetical protein
MFIANIQIFAAMTHLFKGLILEELLTLNIEESITCLVGIWRSTVYLVHNRTKCFL